MKPTPILCRRLKTRISFTTKQVGKGFYRGTGTGSMGAHTQFGNYLIDWRKTRHFVVPNLKDAKLTPFVSAGIHKREKLLLDPSGDPYHIRYDGLQYLKWWKEDNPAEYEWVLQNEQEEELRRQESESEAK